MRKVVSDGNDRNAGRVAAKRSGSSSPKTVLVVCPTVWDADELRLIERNGRYKFIYWPYPTLWTAHPGSLWLALAHLRLFSVNRFVDTTVKYFRAHPIHGVIGTDDYLGAVLASVVAEHLRLPAPAAKAVLTCQHKYYSRLIQKATVPYASPDFDLIERTDTLREPICSLAYPFFAKPVRGTFSILAQRVDNARELKDLVTLSTADEVLWYLRLRSFNSLLARYTQLERSADSFIGEELLTGKHVSLEGYCHQGTTHVMGILDSFMYEGTQSFRRFEYPSRLPNEVQTRMHAIATTLMPALNFDNGLFEIEMYYNPNLDEIRIVEVNPRMCSQFADLFEKVDGTNSYELLLSIATGAEPNMLKEQGRYGVAASFVIRTFKGGRARRLPSSLEVGRVMNLIPDARIRLFHKQGDRLSSQLRQLQDISSVRLAAINIGGADRTDLTARFLSAMKELPFEVEPLNGFDRLLLEVSK